MKNTLNDLNNYLFAQLERLDEEDISEEKLNSEIMRAKAIVGVASAIISNADVAMQAMRVKEGIATSEGLKLPKMLED
ncbi:hypothetical protein [Fusobacterium nucleatum]|jgi:hypothetical protein|uniref:hypothetical protein n=1 Tax=Fusobacterium nucleatum TaxID=851 RepID=UPI0030CB73AB